MNYLNKRVIKSFITALIPLIFGLVFGVSLIIASILLYASNISPTANTETNAYGLLLVIVISGLAMGTAYCFGDFIIAIKKIIKESSEWYTK